MTYAGGEPYSGFAEFYDEMLGATAFECWRENFERLSNRYTMRFETAADIACGTGWAARYLAGRCRRVYAVDRSEAMLRIASRRKAPGEVIVIRQSFEELKLPERVDLLTCNFDSLNYLLEEAALAATFARFRSSLEQGGFAVFDMNTARELSGWMGTEVRVHRPAGAASFWELGWDPGTRLSSVKMTNFSRREGGFLMSAEEHVERAYDLGPLVDMIIDAGFAGVGALDARGLGRVDDETRRVQFVARA